MRIGTAERRGGRIGSKSTWLSRHPLPSQKSFTRTKSMPHSGKRGESEVNEIVLYIVQEEI